MRPFDRNLVKSCTIVPCLFYFFSSPFENVSPCCLGLSLQLEGSNDSFHLSLPTLFTYFYTIWHSWVIICMLNLLIKNKNSLKITPPPLYFFRYISFRVRAESKNVDQEFVILCFFQKVYTTYNTEQCEVWLCVIICVVSGSGSCPTRKWKHRLWLSSHKLELQE